MKLNWKVVLTLVVGLCGWSGVAADAKPNVIFIFADDLAYDCVGFMGNDQVKTPNLDRLASEGTTLTHAYNMGAWHGAICVASRTMINTGLTVWEAKAAEKTLNQEIAGKRLSWGQRMAAAGYQTRMTGKWHVGMKPESCFQQAKVVRPGMPRQTPQGYNRPVEGKPDAWSPSDPKFGGYWQGGKHWSEVVADHGVSFVNEMAKSDKPFFMYLAFNAPHDPRQAPKEYVDMYPQESIKLPQPFYPEYPYDIGSNRIRDEKLAPFPRTEYAIRVNRAEYYAIITHLDAQIGRILDALDASGERDNTWIVFTADHGLAVGHHGLVGKQNMFDHSVRVPFVIVGPGAKKGARVAAPIYLQDVMPTSLEVAGADAKGVRFKSLLPLLKDSGAPHYPTVYGAYMNVQRMVTVDQLKLIVYPKIGKELLFDLKKDPLEITDQSSNPEYAGELVKLRKALKDQQAAFGDDLKL